ncbi:superkiller [Monosporozyma unispora]|nr:superkiller [Kazachstania unispora]
MSKVYIPTTNIGKAHDADIYSVCVTTPYTITCSGDGTIKLWSNNPTTTTINEDGTINSSRIEPDLVKFVDRSGLHHVDAFYSIVNNEIGSLLIIATISFSGNVYFYKLNQETNELEEINNLLTVNELKRSYWSGKFIKSDDLVISHRFIACDMKGDTYVWKLQIQNEETLQLDLSLISQGSIPSTTPVVAICIDVSSSRGLIATGFANGTVIVSQLATLRPLYTFEGYGIQGVDSNSSNSVRTLQFSPGGTLLAVGNDSGSFGCVTLYETEFGERIGTLTVPLGVENKKSNGSVGTFAHNGWVFNLCFNPSGEFLATCGYDAKIRVWDVKSKERVSTLNISANDIEIEDDITLEDEQGDSMVKPPVLDIKYYGKGIRFGSMENESNEGICCVCMDRSIRYFREAGK